MSEPSASTPTVSRPTSTWETSSTILAVTIAPSSATATRWRSTLATRTHTSTWRSRWKKAAIRRRRSRIGKRTKSSRPKANGWNWRRSFWSDASVRKVYALALLGRAAQLVEGAFRAPRLRYETDLTRKGQHVAMRAELSDVGRRAPAARLEFFDGGRLSRRLRRPPGGLRRRRGG